MQSDRAGAERERTSFKQCQKKQQESGTRHQFLTKKPFVNSYAETAATGAGSGGGRSKMELT
eukprot:15336464-Ditylum_brightwellii.AAC.1